MSKMKVDKEFMSGQITLKFDGIEYTILKDGESRKCSIRQYFDLLLRNWEDAIEKAEDHATKLQILRNAQLEYQKEELGYDHPEVKSEIQKSQVQLQEIKKYIEDSKAYFTGDNIADTEKKNKIIEVFDTDGGWGAFFKSKEEFGVFLDLLESVCNGVDLLSKNRTV